MWHLLVEMPFRLKKQKKKKKIHLRLTLQNVSDLYYFPPYRSLIHQSALCTTPLKHRSAADLELRRA